MIHYSKKGFLGTIFDRRGVFDYSLEHLDTMCGWLDKPMLVVEWVGQAIYIVAFVAPVAAIAFLTGFSHRTVKILQLMWRREIVFKGRR